MSHDPIFLQRIGFVGPDEEAEIIFNTGVNVICGASDTGKSFLVEAIDFMLGASKLKEIPERDKYSSIDLTFSAAGSSNWKLERAIAGGDYNLFDPNSADSTEPQELKQKHKADSIDNLSGFLLDKVGLLGRQILKSSKSGKTISLSFRNLASLAIVQENEVQKSGSPYWNGQFTHKTLALATLKLLLTGIDDSAIVSTNSTPEVDATIQVAFIDELIAELSLELDGRGMELGALSDQLQKLDGSIEGSRRSLASFEEELKTLQSSRRDLFVECETLESRLHEIEEFLKRFALLADHYAVDKGRLESIQESGVMFGLMDEVSCPVCGAPPEHHDREAACVGEVDSVVQAASAELIKIEQLAEELNATVSDLEKEKISVATELKAESASYEKVVREIQKTISPGVENLRAGFSDLTEKRSEVVSALDIGARLARLIDRKESLLEELNASQSKKLITSGLSESVVHALSQKIGMILRAWNFPGNCIVHFDKKSSDFIIDGKPRSSRGKGLRAITHAAATLGLFEYCQENELPHPGFVILDSPMLAYYEPEGDEGKLLQGTDLKEKFYAYLIQHHKEGSQVVVVENQHPPEEFQDEIQLTIFTGNPADGRFGLLRGSA